MIRIKPPTHKIDGVAVFVSQHDGAWDLARVTAEREAQIARALEAKRKALGGSEEEQAATALTAAERADAVARSPVERYYAGRTRYQLDAADWTADSKPCTVRDFMRPGERPAEFGLRRLGYRAYQEVATIENGRARLIEAARLGLRSITADGYAWQAHVEEAAGEDQLEALHAARPSLLEEIGAAVLSLSRPLDDEAELPR